MIGTSCANEGKVRAQDRKHQICVYFLQRRLGPADVQEAQHAEKRGHVRAHCPDDNLLENIHAVTGFLEEKAGANDGPNMVGES